MSVFHSSAAWYFCSYELLCRSVDCIFLRYPNLERWYSLCSVQWQINWGECLQTNMHFMSTNFAKTLFWKHETDVKLWRHKQRTPTTNDHNMPLNETLQWKFSAYATKPGIQPHCSHWWSHTNNGVFKLVEELLHVRPSFFSHSTKLCAFPLAVVNVSLHYLPRRLRLTATCGKTSSTIIWSEALKICCHVIVTQ